MSEPDIEVTMDVYIVYGPKANKLEIGKADFKLEGNRLTAVFEVDVKDEFRVHLFDTRSLKIDGNT